AVRGYGPGPGRATERMRTTVTRTHGVSARLREAAIPLAGRLSDFSPLIERIGDARVVLIGEASHGTHEFYLQRAELTKRLMVERGFHAVAVEGDWPDAYHVNAYVRGQSAAPSADAALGGLKRFPTWMWRNRVVLEFVEWA